mmetsp:Transcript_76214/g.184338  ORF Transcript_76214/g.184338 Transcript_76214/m.184338 type:complete len:200 (-) Transcript_76214:1344-1943(-)
MTRRLRLNLSSCSSTRAPASPSAWSPSWTRRRARRRAPSSTTHPASPSRWSPTASTGPRVACCTNFRRAAPTSPPSFSSAATSTAARRAVTTASASNRPRLPPRLKQLKLPPSPSRSAVATCVSPRRMLSTSLSLWSGRGTATSSSTWPPESPRPAAPPRAARTTTVGAGPTASPVTLWTATSPAPMASCTATWATTTC